MLQTSFLPISANCAIVWWITCAIIYNQETDNNYLTGKSIYTSKVVYTWSPNGCCNDEDFKEPSINLNKFRLHAFVTKRGTVTFLLANSRNLVGLKDPAIRSKIWKLWCLCKISIEHTSVCTYETLIGNEQNFLSFAVEVQRLFQIMFDFFPIYKYCTGAELWLMMRGCIAQSALSNHM